MYNPLISIVMPCYNVEKFLPNCFKCLQNQDYKNTEFVFVNDGSTDNTLSILQDFIKDKPNCKLIDGVNCGVAFARNKGIDASTGEWVAFYDVDDDMSYENISTLVKLTEVEGADIVVTGFKFSKKIGQRFAKKDKKIRVYTGKQWAEKFLSQRELLFQITTKMFRRCFLVENGIRFLDKCRYGEDVYFNLIASLRARKVVFTKKKTYHYIRAEGGLTKQRFNKNKMTMYLSLDKMVEVCERLAPDIAQYTHSFRAAYGVEFLYRIKKDGYADKEDILYIIRGMEKDVKYYNKCKKVALYRKIFIPLVPKLARRLFKKVLEP